MDTVKLYGVGIVGHPVALENASIALKSGLQAIDIIDKTWGQESTSTKYYLSILLESIEQTLKQIKICHSTNENDPGCSLRTS